MIQIIAYTQADTEFGGSPVYLDIDSDEQLSFTYTAREVENFDTAQSNFSQSFRLPFTDTNNNFFEHNYNVNAQEGDFSIYNKTFCEVIVDGLPVLKGYLYITSIELKSQTYSVTIIGEIGTLKDEIGDKKLDDLDDSYWFSFRHDLTYDNVVDSWDFAMTYGGSPPITSGIVYPFINYGIDNRSWQYGGSTSNSITSTSAALTIGELKPAIQVKTILNRIFNEAGYKIESNWINNNGFNFDKIFMNLSKSENRIVYRPESVYYEVENSSTQNLNTGLNPSNIDIEFNTEIEDKANTFDTGSFSWTPSKIGTYALRVQLSITVDMRSNGSTTASPSPFMWLRGSGGSLSDVALDYNKNGTIDSIVTPFTDYQTNVFTSIDLELTVGGVTYWLKAIEIDLYDSLAIQITPSTNLTGGSILTLDIDETIFINVTNTTQPWKFEINSTLNFDGTVSFTNYGIPNSTLQSLGNWQLIGQPNTPELETIYIEDNLPDITQLDFLKSIFKQFNLFVEPKQNDPKTLKIEPYPDYIDEGEVKDWTNKLDLDKELVIMPMTQFRKKDFKLEWAKGENYAAKYAQQFRDVPYGGFNYEDESDLLEGEFLNNTIFGEPTNRLIKHAANTPIRNYCVMDLTGRDEDGSLIPLKGKPRIFFFSKQTVGEIDNDFYRLIDPSTGSANEINSYGLASHLSDIPCTSGTFDLNFSAVQSPMYNQSVFTEEPTKKDVFNSFWKRYFNEIYQSDARMLVGYFWLTPLDIHNLRFNNRIFVKDCFYRINKISGYKPNDNAPTKVELIKLFDSTSGIGNNCNLEVSGLAKDGTVSFENGQGVDETPTKECCEAYGFQWVAGEGTSDCYWRLFSNPDNPFEPPSDQFT